MTKTRIGLNSLALLCLMGTASLAMTSAALAFNQAPTLDAAVEAGDLPPVDERLPASPIVLEPIEAIGSYGGELRTDILGGTDRGYGWINRIVGYRTDSLSSAVNNMSNLEEFNRRYESVMRYYGVKPRHTNPASPNENGDCEQSHHRLNRLKRAVEQALLLRELSASVRKPRNFHSCPK